MNANYDMVVIGSGAAGMMAVLGSDPALKVCLVTGRKLGQSNSVMAQGGMQCPMDTPESLGSFKKDIIRSARTPLDAELVDNFVSKVPAVIRLLKSWGLQFDEDKNGNLIRKWAGGLSEPRIISVKDRIGPALIKILRPRIRQRGGLTIREETEIREIERGSTGYRLRAVDKNGETRTLHSPCVIVATGGCSYQKALDDNLKCTNPPNRNHILFESLKKQGLPTIHEDFYQYQPFGIQTAEEETTGRAFPESILNFDVRILDKDDRPICSGRMDRFELSQRMFSLYRDGFSARNPSGMPGFWLVLDGLPEKTVRGAYPRMIQSIEKQGLNWRRLLVFPFLHYSLGGFVFRPGGFSDWDGLFLAGEITGGLHGKNRLMGNGITDSLVHGYDAGMEASLFVKNRKGALGVAGK